MGDCLVPASALAPQQNRFALFDCCIAGSNLASSLIGGARSWGRWGGGEAMNTALPSPAQMNKLFCGRAREFAGMSSEFISRLVPCQLKSRSKRL